MHRNSWNKHSWTCSGYSSWICLCFPLWCRSCGFPRLSSNKKILQPLRYIPVHRIKTVLESCFLLLRRILADHLRSRKRDPWILIREYPLELPAFLMSYRTISFGTCKLSIQSLGHLVPHGICTLVSMISQRRHAADWQLSRSPQKRCLPVCKLYIAKLHAYGNNHFI